MIEHDEAAHRFEAHRDHLQNVAYRMLGSAIEAQDAVQETWLRLARVDIDRIENLGGWLTTVVSRVCLDMLRSRRSRRDELLNDDSPAASTGSAQVSDPEDEAVLVDSVGRALLVVLDRLEPPERIAFVLHDMFAVPFDEIAPVVGRSPVTTKKLASRARQRVRGNSPLASAELARHRRVVERFLAATRAGDVNGVLAVLDPDVVRRADLAAVASDRATEIRGAGDVSKEIVGFGANAQFADLALIDGAVGLVVAPQGRLILALTFAIEAESILEYELIADPTRLRALRLAVVD